MVAADLLGVTENETQITGKAGGSAGEGGEEGEKTTAPKMSLKSAWLLGKWDSW